MSAAYELIVSPHQGQWRISLKDESGGEEHLLTFSDRSDALHRAAVLVMQLEETGDTARVAVYGGESAP